MKQGCQLANTQLDLRLYRLVMNRKPEEHTCDFKLEQTPKGYFTGRYVCTFCDVKISQAQWLDALKSSPKQLGSLPKAA